MTATGPAARTVGEPGIREALQRVWEGQRVKGLSRLDPNLGVAQEAGVFASLLAAEMPFPLPVGAAPNVFAYDSGQLTSGGFFLYGIPASLFVMVVVGLAAGFIWPWMGMPVTLK